MAYTKQTWDDENPLYPTSETRLAYMEEGIETAQESAEAASAVANTALISRVTSLPGTPYDGQRIDYVADGTNGVLWNLRYNAGSASAYKWEFVGGSPMVDGVGHELAALTGTQATAATHTNYQDLATVGPSVTVPLAGDYVIHMSVEGFAGAGTYAMASFAIGGTAASDNDAMVIYNNTHNQQIARTTKKLAIPALTLIRMKYRTYTNVASNWMRRVLTVQPVRVG